MSDFSCYLGLAPVGTFAFLFKIYTTNALARTVLACHGAQRNNQERNGSNRGHSLVFVGFLRVCLNSVIIIGSFLNKMEHIPVRTRHCQVHLLQPLTSHHTRMTVCSITRCCRLQLANSYIYASRISSSEPFMSPSAPEHFSKYAPGMASACNCNHGAHKVTHAVE